MPQGRIILKSISESKKLSELKSDSVRLLYTWLLTHLDVNGCFSGDANVINRKIFTRLKHTNKQVESYLQDMEDNELIIRYEANGDKFLFVPDFQDKQPYLRPDHEGKPTIPLPTTEQLRSNSLLSKVKESKVKESNGEIIKEFFEYYCSTLKAKGWIKQKRQLNYPRKRIIESRLREGATLDDLKRCVDNMCKDNWDKREKYCDIPYCIGIVRGVDNYEKWLDFDAKKVDRSGDKAWG